MVFKPKDKHITVDFPCFTINGCQLNFMSQFRHLGHILSDNMTGLMMMTYEERLRTCLSVLIF